MFTLRLPTLLSLIVCCNAMLYAQSQTPDILPQTSPEQTQQLIRVFVPDAKAPNAKVICYERENAKTEWKVKISAMPAMVGRNGIAPQGAKKEKDGRSPQAEYGIGFLFGVASEAPEGVKIPYRQATPTDFWIDEGEDPRYNCWSSGEKPDVSHENLILDDPRYDLCLTSLYNVNPTMASKGSAIFLHLWKAPDHPTSGCIALSRENVLKILRWLDPVKMPRIRIEEGNPPQE